MKWHNCREIRDRVRIVDLLEELGWQATKTRGAQLRGSCPLAGCEGSITDAGQSPSQETFSVQRDRNIYRCFRCGSKGSVIDFWSAYSGLPIYVAANDLSIRPNCQMQPETSNQTDVTAEPKKQQQHDKPPRESGPLLDRD